MKLVFGVYCYFRYVFAIYICNNCRDDGSVRQRKGDDMRCVCNDGPKMAMWGGDEGGDVIFVCSSAPIAVQGEDEGDDVISVCSNGAMTVQGGDEGCTICVHNNGSVKTKGKCLKVDIELWTQWWNPKNRTSLLD